MNRVYKVIWSKAKHCYVVTSEIAKSHTKGESTGRGLKKLAAALLVAAALMGPNFAWAADTVSVEPASAGSSTAVGSATAVEVYTKEGADKALYDETAARIDADAKVVEAVNSGITLNNENVLQKNTTSVNDDVKVTTERVDVTEMILNKGKDNQITLSEDGIKVGKNSTVIASDGVFAGGDTADAAKAALNANGSIKGANGKFTVDANGQVTANGGVDTNGGNINAGDGTVTGKTITDGTATMTGGALTGVKSLGVENIDASGNITAGGTITGNKLTDGIASLQAGNLNVHDITATGDISGKAITGTSLNTQGGAINGGAITGTTITGTTGSFANEVSAGSVKVTNKLEAGSIEATGNLKGNSLEVTNNATVGGQLTAGTLATAGNNFTVDAAGNVVAKGVDAGSGTIKTTGAVETGTLHATGKANVDGNAEIGGTLTAGATTVASLDAGSGLIKTTGDISGTNITGTNITGDNVTVKDKLTTKDLEVKGEFKANSITLGSKPNNYTEIDMGNVTSKVNENVGAVKYTAESIFNKDGSSITARTDEGAVDSTGKSNVGAKEISQYLGNNAVPGSSDKNVTRNMVRHDDGTFSMEDKAVDGTNSSTVSQNAGERKVTVTDGTKTLNVTENLTNGIVSETKGEGTVTLTQGMDGTYKVETSGTSTEEIGGQKIENYKAGLDTNITGDETHDVSGAMTTTVEGQATENFKNGLDTNITGDETHDVSGAMTTTVEGQATENFKNGLDTNITGDETHDVSGTMTTTVEGQATENFKDGLDTNITGDETHDVSGAMTTTVEGQATENFKNGLDTNITGNETHDVSGTMTTTVEGQATENFKDGLDTNITGDETHDVSGTMTTTVEGQATENYNNGLDTNITGDETHDVSGAMTTTVEGQATENYNNGLDTNITGDETHDVSGAMTTTVEGQATENFKNGLDTNITGDETHDVSGTMTTTVTGDSSLTAENITNEAKNKITNKAIDVETDATSSIVQKVTNAAGSNTSTQWSYQTTEEMSQTDGKTAFYLRGAAEEKSELIDGNVKTTIDTIAGQTNTHITDGTNTSNDLQKADQIASSVTDGTNTTVVNQDARSLASSITDGTGTKVNNSIHWVDGSAQRIEVDDTHFYAETRTAEKAEEALKSGNTVIDIVKDTNTATVSSAVTDGATITGISQNAKDISLSAAGGTITNDANDVLNKGANSVINEVGANQVAVMTDSVKAAYGSDTYTTWNGNGITNNAKDKTVATNAKDILNTATGDMENKVGGNLTNNVTGNMTSNVTGDSSLSANNITNTATVKLSNSAADIENTATNSITDKVGENVERTMGTKKIEESVKDGTKSNTFTKTAKKDMNIITDGTNTSTLSQLADKVNTSLKEVDGAGNTTKSLNNVKTVSEDTTKMTDAASGEFSKRSQTVSQIQDKVGKTTVTTIDGKTTLTDEDHNHTTEMDYANVTKDLSVYRNTTLGQEGEDTNLTVNSKSEFKDTVKMDSTLEVDGTSTFNDKVTITKNGLAVTGGTTTDTLEVKGTSEFGGKAAFKDDVSMDKKLTVKGAAEFKDDVSMGKNLTVTGKTETGTLHVNGDGYVGGDLNVEGNIETHDAELSENSRQVVTGRQLYQTNVRVDKLDNRIKKVGANAAALAALRPGDFNPDDKFSIAAGFGSYRNASAAALGLFYRPNENVLLSLGTSFGDGENMVNAGVSVKFGRGKSMAERRKEMADEVSSMRDEMRSQDERIAELEEMLRKQSELIEKLSKES